MTVAVLLASMTSYEMEEWKAYYRLKEKQAKHDELKSKAVAGLSKHNRRR